MRIIEYQEEHIDAYLLLLLLLLPVLLQSKKKKLRQWCEYIDAYLFRLKTRKAGERFAQRLHRSGHRRHELPVCPSPGISVKGAHKGYHYCVYRFV